jgi:hypothetical protein
MAIAVKPGLFSRSLTAYRKSCHRLAMVPPRMNSRLLPLTDFAGDRFSETE